MTTAAQPLQMAAGRTFPSDQVAGRLRAALMKIAAETSVLRPDWEPLLDSQRVVGAVLVVEDLFPSHRIPPDKAVRKGGYDSVEEAVADMVARIEKIVGATAQPGDTDDS